MSSNIQTNVPMPQNRIAFKGVKTRPAVWERIQKTEKEFLKLSFKQKVQLYIVAERLNHRSITWKTYIKAVKEALGFHPEISISRNERAKFEQ